MDGDRVEVMTQIDRLGLVHAALRRQATGNRKSSIHDYIRIKWYNEEDGKRE